MHKKLMFILVIMAFFILTVPFSSCKAQETEVNGIIYIKADGSVVPLNANITTQDNKTYTFIDDVHGSIIVERDNIVIDGFGHMLQGYGSGSGINLTNRDNVTIRNMLIKNFDEGIRLCNSSNNNITEINITLCSWYAIFAIWSSNNDISKNVISNNGAGIWLKGESSNNTIRENVIKNNTCVVGNGIGLSGVSSNYIYKNTIVNNNYGIWIKLSSSNNVISENNIISNYIYNIWFRESSNNKVYHNNFISETCQAFLESSINIWDNGYPSGGNYWSNYTGMDVKWGMEQNEQGSDGIGDTVQHVDENNVDRYPLMAPITIFEAGVWDGTAYDVAIISNSIIADFHFNPFDASIELNLTDQNGTNFCRLIIPKSLLWAGEDEWTILADDVMLDYMTISDEKTTYLYFTYDYANHIIIQGRGAISEFRQMFLLLLLVIIVIIEMALATKI